MFAATGRGRVGGQPSGFPVVQRRVQCRSLQVMFFRPIFFLFPIPGPQAPQAPQARRYMRYMGYMGYIMAAPPAEAMTLDRFVGPLSAPSSPPPLPAIVAARGCRQGGRGRVRHAKAPLRITPITSRVRGDSRVLVVFARVPLGPPPG